MREAAEGLREDRSRGGGQGCARREAGRPPELRLLEVEAGQAVGVPGRVGAG